MTKTPEELTEDWKAGELEYGQYWVKNKVWERPFVDRWLPSCSWEISCKDAIEQILAPVPTYDEYKAMQAELAEHRRYCCCEENEVMRRKLAEMEEKNKMWDELAENLLCLEEQNWENLVKNGTKEQRLDFLKRKEKYSLLAILDKYEQLKKELESARWYQTVQNEDIGKLRGLLKDIKLFFEECNPHDFTVVADNMDVYLTRINAALGGSEEK